MALQMLQSRKGATAGGADMGPRLVCLGGWDVSIGGLAIGLALFLLLGRSYRDCEFRIRRSNGLIDTRKCTYQAYLRESR